MQLKFITMRADSRLPASCLRVLAHFTSISNEELFVSSKAVSVDSRCKEPRIEQFFLNRCTHRSLLLGIASETYLNDSLCQLSTHLSSSGINFDA